MNSPLHPEQYNGLLFIENTKTNRRCTIDLHNPNNIAIVSILAAYEGREGEHVSIKPMISADDKETKSATHKVTIDAPCCKTLIWGYFDSRFNALFSVMDLIKSICVIRDETLDSYVSQFNPETATFHIPNCEIRIEEI